MQMIEFWIVRKGEDAWKVAPEVGDAISEYPDNKKCLFCGDGHERSAVIAFCWHEPDAHIYTAGICMHCAGHSDEKLTEMTQQAVFADRDARLLSITEVGDGMEAMGLVETVGIEPVTESRQSRLTAKGHEWVDLDAEAKRLSKH